MTSAGSASSVSSSPLTTSTAMSIPATSVAATAKKRPHALARELRVALRDDEGDREAEDDENSGDNGEDDLVRGHRPATTILVSSGPRLDLSPCPPRPCFWPCCSPRSASARCRSALRLAGSGARNHPGDHRAAAHLLLRPSHPRALARGLALPRGERRLQPDVRRRAAPRHARGRRRVLLHGTSARCCARSSASIARRQIADTRRAHRMVHRRRHDPRGDRRARWQAMRSQTTSASPGRSRSCSPSSPFCSGWPTARRSGGR